MNWDLGLSPYDISSDPRATPDQLWELSKYFDWKVQGNVAEHPNTLPDTLHELSTHPSWGVRACVAENPNTPLPTLMSLAKDSIRFVRDAVFNNQRITPAVKLYLQSDGYSGMTLEEFTQGLASDETQTKQ